MQYADLLAARARTWVNIDDDTSSTNSGVQTAAERANDLAAFQQAIADKMHGFETLRPEAAALGLTPLGQRMWYL